VEKSFFFVGRKMCEDDVGLGVHKNWGLGEEKNADDLQGTFKDKKDKISIA
jgi:hypothetical protein